MPKSHETEQKMNKFLNDMARDRQSFWEMFFETGEEGEKMFNQLKAPVSKRDQFDFTLRDFAALYVYALYMDGKESEKRSSYQQKVIEQVENGESSTLVQQLTHEEKIIKYFDFPNLTKDTLKMLLDPKRRKDIISLVENGVVPEKEEDPKDKIQEEPQPVVEAPKEEEKPQPEAVDQPVKVENQPVKVEEIKVEPEPQQPQPEYYKGIRNIDQLHAELNRLTRDLEGKGLKNMTLAEFAEWVELTNINKDAEKRGLDEEKMLKNKMQSAIDHRAKSESVVAIYNEISQWDGNLPSLKEIEELRIFMTTGLHLYNLIQNTDHIADKNKYTTKLQNNLTKVYAQKAKEVKAFRNVNLKDPDIRLNTDFCVYQGAKYLAMYEAAVKSVQKVEVEKKEVLPMRDSEEKIGITISNSYKFHRSLYETAKSANGVFHDSEAWKTFRHSLHITSSLATTVRVIVSAANQKMENENMNLQERNSMLDVATIPFTDLSKSAREYVNDFYRKHGVTVQENEISYRMLCKILGHSTKATIQAAGEYEAYKLADHYLPGEGKEGAKTKALNSDDLRKLRIAESCMQKADRQLEKAENKAELQNQPGNVGPNYSVL